MPLVENEIHTDADYICDFCGEKIETEYEGYCCPVCERIICVSCSVDHPITKVQVESNGPDYKKHAYMCDVCLRAWNKLHPK